MNRKTPHKRIGGLNRRIDIHTPIYARNAIGGKDLTFALFANVFTSIQTISGKEEVIADKITATKVLKFKVRYFSIIGVNETMVITHNGDNYNISSIEEEESQNYKDFMIITATRRSDNIQVVEAPETGQPEVRESLNLGFFQKWVGVNTWSGEIPDPEAETDSVMLVVGDTLTVTEGILIDPNTTAEEEIHQRLFLWRNGQRLIYGVDGDIGFTISGNEIIPNQKVVEIDVVLLHQYG